MTPDLIIIGMLVCAATATLCGAALVAIKLKSSYSKRKGV